MNISELIDAAKKGKGSLGAVAEGLGMHQSRLSDWRAGRRKPEASEIAYLADAAGLPIVSTLADIEAQLHPEYAGLWKKAVRAVRQNQG